MIRLYHGSNQKIEVPDLQHSKPFKDFGRGFYLSPDKQQAWDMAFQKVSQTQQGKAEVTEFFFDETAMTGSHLKAAEAPAAEETPKAEEAAPAAEEEAPAAE